MIRLVINLFCTISIFLIAVTTSFAQTQNTNINLVFIGNSITRGVQLKDPANEAPPATSVSWLRKQKHIGTVAFSNQGHSGYTTFDFLPGIGNTFSQVEQAANAFPDQSALLIFSIKLGTNDSAIQGPRGAPVSPSKYIENLNVIVNQLLGDFPKAIIILQHPIWYSPNTYNGSKYLQEGLTRLQSYIPKIDSLVSRYNTTNPQRVFVGDKKAFNHFKRKHLTELVPEKGQQGSFYLHPNKKGAKVLGKYWAKAIKKCVMTLRK